MTTPPNENASFRVRINVEGNLPGGKAYRFATGNFDSTMSRKVVAALLRGIARDIDPRPRPPKYQLLKSEAD